MQISPETKTLVSEIATNLAKNSDGLSGAEVALVCREAGLFALSDEDMIEKKSANEIFVS